MENLKVITNSIEKIVKEEVTDTLEKAHSYLFFTQTKVIKLLKPGLPHQALKYELRWNTEFTELESELRLIRAKKSEQLVLIRNKLPQQNILSDILINRALKSYEIDIIIGTIVSFQKKYKPTHAKCNIIFSQLLNNFQLQLSSIKNLLGNKLTNNIKQFINRQTPKLYRTLQRRCLENKIMLCHGNLFTSNLFLLDRKILAIDPAYAIRARRIDIVGDFVPVIVDFYLYNRYQNAVLMYNKLTTSFHTNAEIFLLRIFSLLKSLVRIRFALLETIYSTDRIITNTENELIINNAHMIIQNFLD